MTRPFTAIFGAALAGLITLTGGLGALTTSPSGA
jgi:hypothetical protein